MGDRDVVVTALDAWISDFRKAAISHVDNGGDPPDMLNVAMLVANSKANRRAAERAESRARLVPGAVPFGRN